MLPFYADERATVHHGDCLDVLRTLPDTSVDAVVTDPPYGLEFMGKDWDSFQTYAGGNPGMKPQGKTVGDASGVTYGYRQKNPRCRRCGKLQRGNGACKCPEPQWDTRTSESAYQFQAWCEDWAVEVWRILKPGGHMLAFGGTRTWHRLACAIEDTGFEIRDSVAWMHGQGFPKSKNLDGGLGTALKPAFEPVVVARKPLAGTVAATVLAHGTGALNIDGCRVEGGPIAGAGGTRRSGGIMGASEPLGGWEPAHSGRWPANVVLTHGDCGDECVPGCPVADLDTSEGGRSVNAAAVYRRDKDDAVKDRSSYIVDRHAGEVRTGFGDQGGASRFFPTFRYQAKAPTRERPKVDGVAHPTVKPLALMAWLVRLVTPPGGTVLDPFAGSGTTVEAALAEGFRCITIEREAEYLPLILARIERQAAPAPSDGPEQMSLLDEPAA